MKWCKFNGSAARANAGFSLIELMIAMVLGLIVIAGVISVFLAGQQSYRTNEALGDVQDGARTAFELMARDIRDAGLTGCGNRTRVANVLKNPTAQWWSDWDNNGLRGYSGSTGDPASAFGSSTADRIAGTDSLMLLGAEATGASVNADTEPAATVTFNETSVPFANGDVIIICDPDHAALTQITAYAANAATHGATGGSPGNCTKDLSYPTVCSSSGSYVFAKNSQVAKLKAVDWYIGHNAAGSSSLYRTSLSDGALEMVRGVTGMTIEYHVGSQPTFVNAAGVGSNWAQVNAVRVTYQLESTEQNAGVGAKPLKRTFTAVSTVRNRVS